MFGVNDSVLYGTHGVCCITGISKQKIGGKVAEYYILKPIGDENSTVYLPVDNDDLTSKMRRILSEEEIHELIRTMPDETAEWIDNENMRKEKYREVLVSGDRAMLVRIIKAIYLHAQHQKENGKKLHIADERFMKDAEKMLYDEFAFVLNIKRDEVLPLIFNQLDNANK